MTTQADNDGLSATADDLLVRDEQAVLVRAEHGERIA
jgi:hypothetical protein